MANDRQGWRKIGLRFTDGNTVFLNADPEEFQRAFDRAQRRQRTFEIWDDSRACSLHINPRNVAYYEVFGG
jgi:hypothetical protein